MLFNAITMRLLDISFVPMCMRCPHCGKRSCNKNISKEWNRYLYDVFSYMS